MVRTSDGSEYESGSVTQSTDDTYDLYSAMSNATSSITSPTGTYFVPRDVTAYAMQLFANAPPMNDIRIELFVNGTYAGVYCTIPASSNESNIFLFALPQTWSAGTYMTLTFFTADPSMRGLSMMIFANKT